MSIVPYIIGIGVVAIITAVIVMIYFASRYKKVPPDQAMVVYGQKSKGQAYDIVTGGGRIIWPVINAYAFMPLDVRTLEIIVTDIVTDVTESGAKVNIKAVTQVKISSNMALLKVAAEQLLHKTDPEINEIAQKTLEGHVRGICATMTIEDINSDRDKVSQQVQNQAAKDLRNMGIEIKSFVIKEIEDEYGYLDALGVKRTEEVKRDARIGKAKAQSAARIQEAVANRDATIQEANAAREGEKANAEAEAKVAEFHRDRDITVQKAQTVVEVERANREIAFDLQDRKRRQELIQEEVQIEIEEKKKKIELEENEIKRAEREQEADQVVPAKAMANAKIAEADGEKAKIERLAEAEKSRLTMVAEGEAQRITKEGTAEAEIIKLKGQAEAEAIRAKGLAEAEAMEKKAEAWKKYGEAALTQIIVEKLPDIVASASLPLQGTEKIIVLGEQGPSGLVNKTVNIAAEMPALVESLTGIDLKKMIGAIQQEDGTLSGFGKKE